MPEQSFLTHLEELRSILLKCLLAITLTYLPLFFLSPYLIDFTIIWAFPKAMSSLNYFSPLEVFILELKLSFILSLIATFPYCLYQGWNFLLPALYHHERKLLKWWILASSLLFLLGVLFCYILILPLVIQFALNFSSETIKPVIGISSFFSLTGFMMLAFGVMFQFPLAVMLSIRFGLIKKEALKKKRPHVFVIILIVSALITPPDVVSQIMLALPTYLLFELGLFFSKKNESSKSEEQTNTSKEDHEINQSSADNEGMLEFYIKESRKSSSEKDKE